MRDFLGSMVLIFFGSAAIPYASAAEAPPPPQTVGSVFPVAAVIAEVKAELTAAQSTTGASLGIYLQKVELNFALTRSTDADGKVTIGIPVLGGVDMGGSGDRKAEQVSSLLVALTPPSPVGTMSAPNIADFGLTQAIVETRSQLLAGLDQPPKLLPDKVVITLRFVITNSGGPSGRVKFLVFEIGGGVTATSANSSSIELTFAKAKPI